MSVVICYFNSKILPEKNYKIDSLSTYLLTLTKLQFNNYQYIKHQLSVRIKLDLSQSSLDFNSTNAIDYVSIQNDNGSIYYYFVKDKKWVAQSTIALDLYIDSINTFNYTLSDKSRIYRKHSDRWKKVDLETQTKTISLINWEYNTQRADESSINLVIPFNNMTYANSYNWKLYYNGEETDKSTFSLEIGIDNSGSYPVVVGWLYTNDTSDLEGNTSYSLELTLNNSGYQAIIDFYSEGLTPIQYKKKEEIINDDNVSWNLVYSKDTNQKMLVRLVPSDWININTYASIDENANNWVSQYGLRYAHLNSRYIDGKSFRITINGIDYILGYRFDYVNNRKLYDGVVIRSYQNGTTNQLDYYFRTAVYDVDDNFIGYNVSSTPSVINVSNFKLSYVSSARIRFALNTSQSTFPSSYDHTITLTATITAIKPIDEVDRYDETLIKIINLPYSPIQTNKSGNTFTINGSYYLSDGFICLDDFNMFENDISTTLNSPLTPLKSEELNIGYGNFRQIEYETKLYHSDYYSPKFVYDSFNYPFNLEFNNNAEYTKFAFKFKPTSTINSRFLFDFYQEHLKVDINDYSSILNVARNNEELILNDDYINYIRSGYNYDVKNKARTEVGAITGGIGGIVGGALTIAGGVASTNPALVIGGIASISSSIVGTISSIAKTEESFHQKLAQKKLSTISVSGSDDVDLLKYYTKGNKAKLCYYEISDRMKNALYDLFYYTGYNTDEFGNPQDYENTRTYFNYIQADVLFVDNHNITDVFMNDIKARYQIGITILHNVNNTWNFNQNYENWERNIIE